MTVQTDWSNSIMRKVLLFSLKLKGNERSICRTVGNVSERHNLWNNLFTSEFDPFGPVTFAKSSKAAWLCECVSDVEDLGDPYQLFGFMHCWAAVIGTNAPLTLYRSMIVYAALKWNSHQNAAKAFTQTMFSVLVFMCRDSGDTTSKVSCCVEPSYCFKNRESLLKVSLKFCHSFVFICLSQFPTQINSSPDHWRTPHMSVSVKIIMAKITQMSP